MNKGDVANVIAQDGDWIKVQNVWDSKPAAWLMFQNKKGKQLAEAAPDQVLLMQSTVSSLHNYLCMDRALRAQSG